MSSHLPFLQRDKEPNALRKFINMALVKRGDQLSASTVQQSTIESKGKGHVKVLDEETYVQVSVFRKVYTVMSFVCIIGKKLSTNLK